MRWTPNALRKAAERIAEVQQRAGELGVAGLMVVSGGGNALDDFGRGANVKRLFGFDSAVARYAVDVVGRDSTKDNTVMLKAALDDLGVPHRLMAAPNSAFDDIDLGHVLAYTPELAQEAYHHGEVVLMAYGSGKSGQTTDAAVVEYAMWQAQAYPNISSIALKATKFNGVFDSDPAANNGARQYAQISAGYMLKDYERFSAVDRRCLEIINEAGGAGVDVGLQVYATEHSIVEALQDEHLGTLILSREVEPTYAEIAAAAAR